MSEHIQNSCQCAQPNLGSNSTCINCKLPVAAVCPSSTAPSLTRPRDRYDVEMALPAMCLELHNGNTQTSLALDRRDELMDFIRWKELHNGNTQTSLALDRREELLDFIRWRLSHWEAPHHQSRGREFDDTVRAMCEAILRECASTRTDGVG